MIGSHRPMVTDQPVMGGIAGSQSVLHKRNNSLSIQPSAEKLDFNNRRSEMNTFSPKNVIMNARRESEPGRNTEAKLKSSFYKPYDMTLNEHIEFALNKPKFGMDLY